jgi:prepilin-type N-terminal cleavage/methylation domain-containing protein
MMRCNFLRQDGLTLIELLITLSIFSFIGTLIFTVFINGINYSNNAQSTVNIQQEANRIITQLTTWHESKSHYDIILNRNPNATSITLIPYNSSGVRLDAEKVSISETGYEYTLCYDLNQTEVSCTMLTNTIIKSVQKLPVKLILKDKKDPRKTFEIKTIIPRM